jgi:aromatic-L-amino-acid/L-tryptophan decarboxylase
MSRLSPFFHQDFIREMRRVLSSAAATVALCRRLTLDGKALPDISSCDGLDWEAFRGEAHQLIDYIADRHVAAEKAVLGSPAPRSVGGHWGGKADLSGMERALQRCSAESPKPFSTVVSDVEAITTGMIDWQSKGFLSFFPGQLSPAAMLGELLALSYNHAGFAWSTCPASTELEFHVVDTIGRLLGLPSTFLSSSNSSGGGSIHPNATEGLLVAMIAARDEKKRLLLHTNQTTSTNSSFPLVCYTSDQAHFSVEKACKMAGILLRKVPCILDPRSENYPLHPETLEEVIAEDIMNGKVPLMIVGTIGTTATCAIDPTRQLAAIAKSAGAWLHVDAAYAGAAALCPELRPVVFDGIELCDSVSVNGSKWMAMSMGCSFLLTRHLSLISRALSCGASYVPKPPPGVHDLKDVSIGMARPWTSLKVYSVLRCVGVDALQGMIRRHVILAEYLDAKLRAHPSIDCVVRPVLGLVVFRVRMISDEDNAELQRRLSTHRNLLVGASRVDTRFVLRVSLAHIKLTYEDVDNIYSAICQELKQFEA